MPDRERPPDPESQPGAGSPDRADARDDLPRQLGPYRLLEVLGEGGMGVVYLADQSEPLRRRVAVKVIKPGMDTKLVLARFDAERQALAVMDHPGIAAVYDGGVTEQGRPYFAMELVRGIPIIEYCESNTLSVRERLELFIDVCHAVQHAHQKGVVHRDLKPSNILVVEENKRRHPKVIDFGIAKAIDRPLTDETLLTQTGHMVGTPAYMSPEQAEGSGLDIDTRSDVYSLGVILYELLIGHLPFEARELQGHAALFTLLERDPPTPSRRFNGLGDRTRAVAGRRRTDTGSLVRTLRGDLDWVVMKAIEKERSRRYETVNGLAQDIERFLSDEPVSARAPSVPYRMRKFIKRHRVGVAAAATLFIAILASSVVIGYLAVEANRARADADRRRGQAEELLGFMLGDLRSKLEPIGRLDLLGDVGDQALSYFASVPVDRLSEEELLSRAQALNQIGEVRVLEGNLAGAQAAFGESLALAQALASRSPSDPDHQVGLGASHFWVGYVRYLEGDLDAALPEFEAYRAISEQLVARDPDNLNWQLELAYANTNIAAIHEARGDLRAARGPYRASLDVYRTLVEKDPDNLERRFDLASGHNRQGNLLLQIGELAEAEKHFQADLDIKIDLLAREPDNSRWQEFSAVAHYFLARVRDWRGDLEGALDHRLQELGTYERLTAHDPENSEWRFAHARARRNVVWDEFRLGRAASPDALGSTRIVFEELAAADPTRGQFRRSLGVNQRMLGIVLLDRGQLDRAERALLESVSVLEKRLDVQADDRAAKTELAQSLLWLGELRSRRGAGEAARESWERSVSILKSAIERGDEAELLAPLAAAYLKLGRVEDARPLVGRLVAQGYREAGFLRIVEESGLGAEITG